MLLAISGAAVVHLFILWTNRAQEVRQELLQRDLRDLIGRFDGDERFVIEKNLQQLLTERRTLQPLLLPRQYYSGLPATAASFLPRQPPRNCFVRLLLDSGESSNDRLCMYFSENKAPGRYLYINARFEDADFIQLRPGDSKFLADALKLTLAGNGRSVTWWLTFQLPPIPLRRDRFEVAAFREVDALRRDRDRKVEGWAYQQAQPHGTQLVQVIARLDYKAFLSEDEEDAWPPTGWRDTSAILERRDAKVGGSLIETMRYRRDGLTDLSLSSLGAQIFNAYGTIALEGSVDGKKRSWQVEPPAQFREKLQPGYIPIKTSGGDILWPSTPSTRSEPLPETTLVMTVSQPWMFVEKGFWQIAIYLVVLFVGGVWTTAYFRRNLLGPIADWSRHSEDLAKVRTDSSVALPYAERRNEIGILAKAINALIDVVREQTARAHAERAERDREVRRKQEEEMQNRMQNMTVIGHEIRAPLQALMALHPDSLDRSRHHIDRMNAALPHLLGGAVTADAISSRSLSKEEIDLARFLVEVADNAGQLSIPQVTYSGPPDGVVCVVDDGALEDVLANLLRNAHRHRDTGTEIQVTLVGDGESAVIEIANDGPAIPDELATRIFDFGISTVRRTEEAGRGIGLYVARNYLTRMGGTLAVRNHARGVVFTITLPRISTLL
jgi:signal transduction histidine kinase